MEVGGIYGFVLTLVLVGIIIGAGVLVLDKFGQATGITTAAETAINGSRDAVDDWVTWLPIIVIMGALAVILTLVMKSFRG